MNLEETIKNSVLTDTQKEDIIKLIKSFNKNTCDDLINVINNSNLDSKHKNILVNRVDNGNVFVKEQKKICENKKAKPPIPPPLNNCDVPTCKIAMSKPIKNKDQYIEYLEKELENCRKVIKDMYLGN